MAGGSSSTKTSLQGAWLGSEVCEGHIKELRHHRLLPTASQVLVLIPDAETAPTPAAGEIVVFDEHFYRGFGLPASPFFSEWLHFFGLQPHHLAWNAILQLPAFVVLCEGYLGIEPRSASSEGSENAQESEGTEPSREHLRPSIVDWMDDDETPSSLSDAAFEEDSDGVEEVTSPSLTRGWRHRAEATGADEAARKQDKGATASRPAPQRPATGPPAGALAGGAKKRRGGGRRQVPIVAGEVKDMEEDTASVAERASLAMVDAAQRELEVESKRRWDAAAGKTAESQSRPSRAEKPAEKRTKARHDPSTRARVEETASKAAPRT
ncbi:hypothetical protein D1007_42651 [Hordeum vulgare]|nr:hypothetical protein D1007_42651 [Hordeum vulgare]